MYHFDNRTLNDGIYDVMQYLSNRFPDEPHRQLEMCELMEYYPNVAIDILKNTASPNYVKQNQLQGYFRDYYPVAVLIGMTGSGKTAFCFWISEELHRQNHDMGVYLIGFPVVEGIPDYFHFVSPEDISKIPNNSLIIVDEVGLIFNTKNWNSPDNVEVKKLMSLKRQQRKRYIFGSQLSSEVSVEMIRRADYLLLRKFSLVMTETDGRKEIYERLIPFLVDMQEEMLFISETVSGRNSMILSTPLPSFWVSDISNAFGNAAQSDTKAEN